MRKGLSKQLAVSLAMALSVVTTATPVAQAATNENQEIVTEQAVAEDNSMSEKEASQKTQSEEETKDQIQASALEETKEQGTNQAENNPSTEVSQEVQESGENAEETTTDTADASAEKEVGEDKIQEVTQVDSGTCGENLSWRLTSDGKLYIEGTGDMKDYNNDNSPEWDTYRDSIVEVSVSEGVTKIGDYAFYYCSSLSEIELPDGVTSIGEEAFCECSSLSKIELPDGVTSIGGYAFLACSSLSKIELPDSVTDIGGYAFYGCSSLSKIKIPDGVTSIGTSAFYDCSSLNKIELPTAVASVGKEAFDGCSNLSKITFFNKNCTIYDVIKTIPQATVIYGYKNSTAESYAGEYEKKFVLLEGEPENTYSVTYDANGGKNAPAIQTKEKGKILTLSKSKPTRKGYTFLGWSTSETSTEASYGMGASFEEDENTILYAVWQAESQENIIETGSCGKNLSWRILDNGKLYIEGTGDMEDYEATEPTWRYSDVEEVYLSEGVTKIGDYAFRDCQNLREIEIPDSVTSIGDEPFYGCRSLSEIELPDGVTSIGEKAFCGCRSLSKIELPDSVTDIGGYAFYGCSSLSKIKIPDGVTSIGNRAFFDCSNLSKIELPDSVTDIGGYAFYGCSSLSEIELPDGVTSIGEEAFCYCSSLSTIELPDGVTSIGEGAFEECSSLSKIELPDGVTSIGESAFCDCSSLNEITIFNKNCEIPDDSDWTCTIPNTTKIYGYKGSTAESYATKYGKTFVALADEQTTTYLVTYDANGGENASATQTKEKDKALTLSKTAPTRTGYSFLGWSTSKDSTEATYKPGATFEKNENMTLYAVWKANTYKVAFNKNNGTGSMATKSYTYGKNYTLTANTFKRTGYTFNGWNTKANGTGKTYANQASVKNLTSVAGKTITLYAQWKLTSYGITYQLNGGTNNKANPASYTMTTATITLKNPTKKGYTFGGWYTNSKYTTKVTKIAKGSMGKKTFYAKWTANQYTIRYNKNGATSGKMSDTTSCKYGKSYTLRKNTFQRTGYVFNGWNTKANGTGKTYANQASVKNLTAIAKKTVTLYAQWKPTSYGITYQLNGGINNKANPASYTIATATITLKNPTKKGYTFGGWYTSSKYTAKTKVTKITKGSIGKKTLYAKWIVNQYTIRYNSNGATGGKMADTKCQYDKTYSLRKNAFSKEGYTFLGWAYSANGKMKYKNGEKIKNISSINKKVVTLYAVWQANEE